MSFGPDREVAGWQRALRVTTLVFTVWYFTYLYRWELAGPLATAVERLHGVAAVVPTASERAIQAAVIDFVVWGLWLSVALFFVAFGLFHRAAEAERASEAERVPETERASE